MKTALKSLLACLITITAQAAPFTGVLGYLTYTHNAANTAVTITDYDPAGTGAEGIPIMINGLPVTQIGDYAFANCPLLNNVTIPNSVTVIGSYTFSGCTGLTSVSFPSSTVTSIGINTFIGCSQLTTVVLPEKLTSLPNNTFRDCISLPRVSLPGGLTSIGSSAFSGCTALTGIMLPAGVTSVGNYAFRDCTSLRSLYFEGDAPAIDPLAFTGTSAVTVYRLLESSGWQSNLGGVPTAIWDIIIRTSISSSTNSVEIRFNTNANLSYRIEASPELSTWSTLDSQIIGQGVEVQRSYPTSGIPARFFRVRRN